MKMRSSAIFVPKSVKINMLKIKNIVKLKINFLRSLALGQQCFNTPMSITQGSQTSLVPVETNLTVSLTMTLLNFWLIFLFLFWNFFRHGFVENNFFKVDISYLIKFFSFSLEKQSLRYNIWLRNVQQWFLYYLTHKYNLFLSCLRFMSFIFFLFLQHGL